MGLGTESDYHTSLFRGADDGKAETSAPTCNTKTSFDTARVPRIYGFSRATLSVAFLLSSTCSQLESNVSWRNACSVALTFIQVEGANAHSRSPSSLPSFFLFYLIVVQSCRQSRYKRVLLQENKCLSILLFYVFVTVRIR